MIVSRVQIEDYCASELLSMSPGAVATTQTCAGDRTYTIRVDIRPPLRIRCCDCFKRFARRGCSILFLVLLVSFCTYLYGWIPSIIGSCHRPPGILLQTVSIRDMAVYQNTTAAAPDSPWLVSSDFNLSLSTRSPNTVAKCFTTFREMVVAVRYRGDLILRQEVNLRFSLRPRENRELTVAVKGEQASLRQQLGPVLEAELRSDAGQIVVEFYFDTRYLIADRRSKWKRFGCQVVATTPQKGSGAGRLLSQRCKTID
ncbi:uncharacterized protein [Physcomitrium patens]|uniref:Late embryogenesis abundant protein LEA-2 subgroup domain-containing protein n=2 Tax=Physcomitrium patens TaxID=3218 RepID=A0A7I4EHU2_PHYPA|nr:uncharacterized protein LOC112286460 isoform X1 [Physcomitrium patens]|eukprot:XP_024384132.1 uncharacterized protein LOC112286460 isoform X1 [Physcomitrella patens]